MSRKLLCLLAALLLVGTAFRPTAAHAQEQIGILAFDPGSGGSGDEFDIQNITGPTDSGLGLSTTTPYVTGTVLLDSLSLTVTGGSGAGVYGSSYFSASPFDTISFNGTPEDFAGATSAVLTGDFSTTSLVMSSGGPITVLDGFTTTLTGTLPGGLLDDGSTDNAADTVYIIATNTTGGGGPVTPEPEPFIMVGTGLTALVGIRRKIFMASLRRFVRGGF